MKNEFIKAEAVVCDSCGTHSMLYMSDCKEFPLLMCKECMDNNYAVGPMFTGYLVKEKEDGKDI